MSSSTKKPLQVRMGKEKAKYHIGSIQPDDKSYFEMSRQGLNYAKFNDYSLDPY